MVLFYLRTDANIMSAKWRRYFAFLQGANLKAFGMRLATKVRVVSQRGKE